MLTFTIRLFLFWAYVVMICLPASVNAQTEPQKTSEYCSVSYINGCSGNNGLSSVQINNVAISQNSGCSIGGYSQFTAISTTLTVGHTNTFSITLLDPTRPNGITIWADLNRNYSIDTGEDLYLSNGPLSGPISGTFTIPITTPGGPLRLRVLSAYNTMPFWPCSTQNGILVPYDSGESEDYTVMVVSPITSLTTTNITHDSAQLSWVNSATGVSHEIQYRIQGSPDWNTRYSSSTQYTLSNLSDYMAYEWRVRQSGTTEYYGPVSFTTFCAPAYVDTYTYPTRTMARLYWTYRYDGVYTLLYRIQGTTSWTTITDVTVPSGTNTSGPHYSLTGLTPATPYEFQVQRHCSPTAGSVFSNLGSFTTLSCSAPEQPAIQTFTLRSNSVSLAWSGYTEPGQTFQIRHRPVGTATWTTIDSITATYVSLTGITPSIPYEWQVQRVCSPTESSSFSPGPTFTLACALPISLNSTPNATGASLGWQIEPFEANKLFDIQYRIQGTAEWTTLSSLSILVSSFGAAAGVSLTGLARNTAYDWRLRSICPTGVPSEYTDVRSFTTTCASPNQAVYEQTTAASVRLYWYGPTVDATTRHEIRYRPVGTPDWTTIGNLGGGYVLTGLTNNTAYEFQVRAVCSPTESGSFTPPVSFTTRCSTPTAYNVFSGVIPRISSARLYWSHPSDQVQAEVHYRPEGSDNWQIISNIPPIVGYSTSNTIIITNLRSNTPYEWKVRILCENGIVSDFSNVASFTTLVCSIPFGFNPSVSDHTASLDWTYFGVDADTRFAIRWRAVGAPTWNSEGNLTVTNNNGVFLLTGLTPNTAYEWQIRARCTENEITDFSTLYTFQTLSPCNSMLHTIRHGNWTDPATWSCNRVPLLTDIVQIRHTVFLLSNRIANALRVQFEPGGKIFYSVNSRLRLGL